MLEKKIQYKQNRYSFFFLHSTLTSLFYTMMNINWIISNNQLMFYFVSLFFYFIFDDELKLRTSFSIGNSDFSLRNPWMSIHTVYQCLHILRKDRKSVSLREGRIWSPHFIPWYESTLAIFSMIINIFHFRCECVRIENKIYFCWTHY